MLAFKSKELAIFYEKLGQLYRTGVPIAESLPMASMQVRDSRIRRGAQKAQFGVLHGSTLTEGFAQSPDIFTDMQVALIRVGETQGRLDETLMNLSSIYENEYKDLKRFLFAMAYPTFLLFAAIFLPPLVTWFTQGLEAYFKEVFTTLTKFALPAGIIYLLYFLATHYFENSFDRFKLSVPILGGNLKKLALARFSRNFARLFESGLEMSSTLKLSIKAMGNSYLQSRCRIVQTALDEGATLSSSLQATNIFPPNLIHMVTVGEQTGELDKMLDKAAEYYEFEANKTIKAMLGALPVVIYLMVAAYIAYIVISFYTGYFNAIGNLAK